MMSDFTPRGQQVLALARQEAERFNHHYVGTEHLLLGLIGLGQGVAVNVLKNGARSGGSSPGGGKACRPSSPR
jgi:ATP-dependent Clp protease ATP-binding subunit ClpA